jgi:alanyl-tRNA synthetase
MNASHPLPVGSEFFPRVVTKGGAVPGKEIRVIRIGDFDVEACGGIHCKNSLEVGAIKILRTKRIQDGVVRLEFVSGMPAIEQLIGFWNATVDASARLNTTPDKINEAVAKLMADKKDLTKEIDAMKKGRVGETVDNLLQKAVQTGGAKIVRYVESEDIKHLISLAKELIDHPKTIAVLGSDENGVKMVIARSPDLQIDCRPLMKEAMSMVNGSGGGKPDFAQGGGQDAAKLEAAVDRVMAMVKSSLEKE